MYTVCCFLKYANFQYYRILNLAITFANRLSDRNKTSLYEHFAKKSKKKKERCFVYI